MSLKEGHRPTDRDIPNRRVTTANRSDYAKWQRDDSLTAINNRVAEQALEGKSQRHTHRVSSGIIDLLVWQTTVLSESLKDDPVAANKNQYEGETRTIAKKRRVAQEGLFLSE